MADKVLLLVGCSMLSSYLASFVRVSPCGKSRLDRPSRRAQTYCEYRHLGAVFFHRTQRISINLIHIALAWGRKAMLLQVASTFDKFKRSADEFIGTSVVEVCRPHHPRQGKRSGTLVQHLSPQLCNNCTYHSQGANYIFCAPARGPVPPRIYHH